MTDRMERIEPLLQELAAEFINGESNRNSMITVTHVDTARDLANATVYISVFPEEQEHAALDFLKRKRSELRSFIKGKANLKRIPFLEIELDQGEKHRQRIDESLQQ